MSNSGDPLFSNVTLLLSGDSYTDASYSGCSVIANGIIISGDLPSIGNSSFEFPNTLTGLPFIISNVANSNITANTDFTIEFSAFCSSKNRGSALFSNRNLDTTNSTLATGLLIGIEENGIVFVRASSGNVNQVAITASKPIVLDALHSFALQRRQGVWTLYIDGTPVIDNNDNNIWNGAIDSSGNIYLGCDPFTGTFTGGIGQIRITMGYARYSGRYQIAIIPFPIYPTTANIVFGPITKNVSTINNNFFASITLTNTESASIEVLNGANQPIGSNWQIVPFTEDGVTIWNISGIAPLTVGRYKLIVTATTPVLLGSLSASNVYLISNTLNGTLSPEQQLLSNVNNLQCWLDANDSTTLFTNSTNGNVISFIDKAFSTPFNTMSNMPAPLVDMSSFSLPSITFPNNSKSGLISTVQIPATDENSNSVIFLVGKYSGQQLGQGGGLFQLSYLPDGSIADGVSNWNIETTNVGIADANVSLYDNASKQDIYSTVPSIIPGQSFLVVWKTANNSVEIFINQVLVNSSEISNTTGWSTVNSSFSFIGGASSPNGSFISLGELIVCNGTLDQSTIEQIESYLNHKWNLYPLVPVTETPTVLIGYSGQEYSTEVTVLDSTSLELKTNIGTNWNLTQQQSGSIANYLVSGILPNTTDDLILTFNSFNGSIAGVDEYTVKILPLIDGPIIQSPDNLACQVNVVYVSLINIINATNVEIACNVGSNWSIAVANNGINTNYLITGNMPADVGNFNITITATLVNTNNVNLVSTSTFTIAATNAAVVIPDLFPIDLTGMLTSNLIVEEQQTLTMYNGPRKQLIIPSYAPFFGESLIVQYYDASAKLCTAVKDIDYNLFSELENVSSVCQTPVYSGISFSNLNITGTILLTYQTIGGNFVHSAQESIMALFNYFVNPKNVLWDNIVDRPNNFPVNKHNLNVQNDSNGYSGLITAITNLSIAIGINVTESDVNDILAHKTNTNNPHNVTASQLGLGNVQNYPVAMGSQITDKSNASVYLTPASAYQSFTSSLTDATDLVYGQSLLNLGTLPLDDVDNSKALTAGGLINLINSNSSNAINTFLNNKVLHAQQLGKLNLVGMSSLTFPSYWKGRQYNSLNELIVGVQTYVGMSPIPFNTVTNTFYFENDVTIPDLTISLTNTINTSVLFDGSMSCNLPLVVVL